jgi:class 3 adenylate cyclase
VAISFVFSFLLDLNSLLGQNVLLSFVTGRYFRPRVEQRVFLIIDMRNSTATAERLGEVVGDTMNTASRIVDSCRDSGEPVIVSAALLHQIAVPLGIAARALGPIQLRGKKSPIELFALQATTPAVARSPAE